MSLQIPEVNYVFLEPFFPHTDTCCICEEEVVLSYWSANYGIPMYEGIPVPPEWQGDWGGFSACKACFDKYERGEMDMWPMPIPAITAALAARTQGAK